jgi:polyisoprenoid-binding protein YceI
MKSNLEKTVTLAFMFSLSLGFSHNLLAEEKKVVESKMVETVWEAEGGATKFLATASPGFLKIDGSASPVVGKVILTPKIAKGNFELDLASLKSGIELRDDHMKNKYLDVKKYPKAELEISSIEMSEDLTQSKEVKIEDKKFTGALTMRGKKVPVEGVFSVNRSANDSLAKLNAKFEIDIVNFDVEIPSYLGVKVAKTVKLEISSDLKKQ